MDAPERATEKTVLTDEVLSMSSSTGGPDVGGAAPDEKGAMDRQIPERGQEEMPTAEVNEKPDQKRLAELAKLAHEYNVKIKTPDGVMIAPKGVTGHKSKKGHDEEAKKKRGRAVVTVCNLS